MITGGWEYVIAAYAMLWVVLGSYAVSIAIRWRRLERGKK